MNPRWKPRTRGQQLFCELRASTTTIARTLGWKAPRVSMAKAGRYTPDDAERKEIERCFGIPAIAWAAPPESAPKPAPAQPPARSLPAAAWEAPAPPPDEPSTEIDPTQGIRGMMATAEVYRAWVATLPDEARVPYLPKLFAMQMQIAKAQKERPVEEDTDDKPDYSGFGDRERLVLAEADRLRRYATEHPGAPAPAPVRGGRLAYVDASGAVVAVAPVPALAGTLEALGWPEWRCPSCHGAGTALTICSDCDRDPYSPGWAQRKEA